MQKPHQRVFANMQRACRPSLTGLRVQGLACHPSPGDPTSNMVTKRELGVADLGGGRTPVGISCGAIFSLTGVEVNIQSDTRIKSTPQPSCGALPLVSCAWAAMPDQALHRVSTPRSASTLFQGGTYCCEFNPVMACSSVLCAALAWACVVDDFDHVGNAGRWRAARRATAAG
jgi:hypothetical protein